MPQHTFSTDRIKLVSLLFAILLSMGGILFFPCTACSVVGSVRVIYTVGACSPFLRSPEPGMMVMILESEAVMWWPLVNYFKAWILVNRWGPARVTRPGYLA
jgi:hypothetical protein